MLLWLMPACLSARPKEARPTLREVSFFPVVDLLLCTAADSRPAALGPALPHRRSQGGSPSQASCPGPVRRQPASLWQAEAGQQPLPPMQHGSWQRSEGQGRGEEARRPGRAQACCGGGRVLTAGTGDLRGPLLRSWRFPWCYQGIC